jgi:hypothetical protein
MNRLQVIGLLLLAGAAIVGLLLEALGGLLFVEVDRASLELGPGFPPLNVALVETALNWRAAVPLALAAATGLGCLLVQRLRRT